MTKHQWTVVATIQTEVGMTEEEFCAGLTVNHPAGTQTNLLVQWPPQEVEAAPAARDH